MYKINKKMEEGSLKSLHSGNYPVQRAENQTGIPQSVKDRFETASGLSFDDVRVHYNSARPSAIQAYAYTKGNEVYIGPGQEKHLKHELGHVVQQKRGMVRANGRIGSEALNDDARLEQNADSWRNI